MLARLIATLAALMLACASPQASAYVRAESAIAYQSKTASELKTAPPARARPTELTSGKNAALSHCHVGENWSPLQECAAMPGVYQWDGTRLAGRTNALGNTLGDYQHAYGWAISSREGSERSTLHTDSHGTPQLITTPTGAIAGWTRTDVWGVEKAQSGAQSRLGHTGYLKDPLLGDELYAQARQYRAGVGRFTSVDPWAGDQQNPVTLNKYLAFNGNPTVYVDPDGRVGIFNDGTWNDRYNEATIRDNGRTNVSALYDLYEGRRFYQDGVGTDWYSSHTCGATGCGFNARVDAAYRAIERVYNDPKATKEDKAIDIFGFSRGAAESRALVNKLIEEGIPVTRTERQWVPAGTPAGGRWEKRERTVIEKPNIRFVGLFDTVPALGDPSDPDSTYHSLYAGHGQEMDFDKVGKVSHALAADEGRVAFDLRSLKPSANSELPANAEEVFFRGAHSDIGGGYGDSEGGNHASFYPLAYIHREAREAGVPLADSTDMAPLLGELESVMKYVEGAIHDSRYLYERFIGRRERTVYYDSGSETMTYGQMAQRAREFAKREARLIVEGADGNPRLGPPK